MKVKELMAMPADELRSKLSELKKELMKENAQVALGATLKNPGKLKMVKKNIARIMTIQKKQLGVENVKHSIPPSKNVGGIEKHRIFNTPKYKSVGGTEWTKSTSARLNTKRVGGS